jgi:hypothetical protein
MSGNVDLIIKGYSIDYNTSLFTKIRDDFDEEQGRKRHDEEKSREFRSEHETRRIKDHSRIQGPTGAQQQLDEAQEEAKKIAQEIEKRAEFAKEQDKIAAAVKIQAAIREKKIREDNRKALEEKVKTDIAAVEAREKQRQREEEEERKRQLEEERREMEAKFLNDNIRKLEDLNDVLGDRYIYIKNSECIDIFKIILKNTVSFVKDKLTGDGTTEGDKNRFIKGDNGQEMFLKSFKLVKFEGKEIRVPNNKVFEEKLYSIIRKKEKESFEKECMRDYNIVYDIIEYCLFILGNKKYKRSFFNKVQTELDNIKENTGIKDFYRFIEMKKKYDSLQDCITSPFNNL